ncbi:MAG TPA: hypothetical protein VGQ83_18220 [Polyangia bacterium]
MWWGAFWPSGDGTVDTYRRALPPNWWTYLSTTPLAQIPTCPGP